MKLKKSRSTSIHRHLNNKKSLLAIHPQKSCSHLMNRAGHSGRGTVHGAQEDQSSPGRTDELQSIRNRINSTSTLLNVFDQRTFAIKTALDRTLSGLEQVYKLQKGLRRELQDHMEVLKEIRELATPPPRPRSPQPGPSHQVEGPPHQQLRCALCDDDHHTSDRTRFRTLSDRRHRIFERNRCERCLLEATHLATSCPKPSFCFYCSNTNRSNNHHSAFCPYKFRW